MEMDLAPFYPVIYEPSLFALVWVWSASGVFVWLSNLNKCKELGTFVVIFQAVSKCWQDTALVAGILATTIGVMGVTANFDMKSVDSLYEIMPLVLATLIWGGVLTGLGYCGLRADIQINFKIQKSHLLIGLFIFFFFLIWHMSATEVPVREFFLHGKVLAYFFIPFIVCFVVGYAGHKSKVLALNKANLVATLCGMGIGISLWFVDGANYQDSRDAIYFIANILMYGSLFYLLIYLWSLHEGTSESGNFEIKTWHFAEAAAFFLFLVYAPVGTTEYLRESTDQANQQENNEAQELRIEQLEAKIKLLTEKVGEFEVVSLNQR